MRARRRAGASAGGRRAGGHHPRRKAVEPADHVDYQLLNLEKLAYLSSAGLRVILRAAKQLQENRGELTICNAKGGVRDALETFGLHSLMKIYNTEKEALLHFSSDELMDASRQSRASPAVSASRSAVVSLVCRSSCATSRRPKRLAHFRGPRSNDVGRSSSRPASRGSSFGPASLMSPKTRTERFTLGPHLGRH